MTAGDTGQVAKKVCAAEYHTNLYTNEGPNCSEGLSTYAEIDL